MRQGYILLQTMIVIAGLVALLAMMVADQHAAVQRVQDRLRERRAQQAASAGIAQALAALQGANTNVVTLSDTWAQLGATSGSATSQTQDGGNEAFTFGDGSQFRMQIVDAGSFLNVNTLAGSGVSSTAQTPQSIAWQPQLSMLPLNQQQIDCLLDWVQTDVQPRSDGAKDSFYNALTQPYNTKLGPLTTVDELLLVDNWTAQTLYQPPTQMTTSALQWPTDQSGNQLPLAALLTVDSESPNTQADGSARLNLDQRINPPAPPPAPQVPPSPTSPWGQLMTLLQNNTSVARQVATATPLTSFSQLFTKAPGASQYATQLLNGATFTSATGPVQGKINLNTASQAVLEVVPNMSSNIALAIVSQQSSGFQTLGALTNVIPNNQVGQFADYFTIGGDTWIVRVYGEDAGVGVAIEAVARLTNTTVQIISWHRLNTAGIPSWWDWDAQPGTSVDAATGS